MNKQTGSMILTLFAVVTLSLHTPQVLAKDYTPPTPATSQPARSLIAPTIAQGEIKSAQSVPPTPAPTPAPTPPPTVQLANASVTGDKNSWLAASGIAQSDWNYVDYIVSRESGWNPASTNASSGAHGLPQAMPYSKTGCSWIDAVCQLRWANGYATSRYGSWAGAYNHWLQNQSW